MNKAEKERIEKRNNFVIKCTLNYMCKKLGIDTTNFLPYNHIDLNKYSTIYEPVKTYFQNLPKPPIIDKTFSGDEYELD